MISDLKNYCGTGLDPKTQRVNILHFLGILIYYTLVYIGFKALNREMRVLANGMS